MDTPEPLTAAQAQYAAALPDAEQEQFAGMSSADRDDLLAVMGWMAPALVEARQDDLAAARDVVAEQRRQDDRPGGYWPRNPETAPHPELERAELDALLAADDTAIDQALAALDQLLTRAARHKDLARRSRQLARVDRALADPGNGILKRLRELRSSTLRERRDAGVPVEQLAREAGVGTRRMFALLAEQPNQRYVSPEMQTARAQVRAEQTQRAAAAKARREAERTATLAQGAVWAAQMLAGSTPATIAEREGVSRQRVVAAIRAANQAAETAA